MTDILKKIMKTPSISGMENAVCGVIRTLMTPYADEISKDSMGNLIAFRHGSAPEGERKKIMLAAHMDEIGFIVIFIDDKGFARISNIGGISWAAAAYSHVIFENGIRGVIIPDAKCAASDFAPDKFVIDIGASSKKDAEKKIKIGDFAVVEPSMYKLSGKRFAGRPFDDRIGCAVLIYAAAHMSSCINDTYFVFTVQEEVGCRGARTAAFGIMPDVGIAFDVTDTGDAVGARAMAVTLGGGAAIKVKDSSVICDSRVVNALVQISEQNKIKYQKEILEYGGTDTSAIQIAGAGVAVGCISVPARYIHSPVEEIDMRDVYACAELALYIIEKGIKL